MAVSFIDLFFQELPKSELAIMRDQFMQAFDDDKDNRIDIREVGVSLFLFSTIFDL